MNRNDACQPRRRFVHLSISTPSSASSIRRNSDYVQVLFAGWVWKAIPPATFVDVSAVRANFCMRFHTTVMQQNIPFSTKFVEKLSENDKIVLFQPSQPPFLSVPSVVFTGSLLVALKRAVLLAIRWGHRLEDGPCYCRWKRQNYAVSARQLPPSYSSKTVPQSTRHTARRLRTFASTLSICKSAFLSHHQLTSSSQGHQQTTGEDNAGNAEKWERGCLGWNNVFGHFQAYFNKTWWVRVYFTV